MKIITYKCNLCGETFNSTERDSLYQYYWDSAILPQRYVLEKINNSRPCDKHICCNCVDTILQSEVLNNPT